MGQAHVLESHYILWQVLVVDAEDGAGLRSPCGGASQKARFKKPGFMDYGFMNYKRLAEKCLNEAPDPKREADIHPEHSAAP